MKQRHPGASKSQSGEVEPGEFEATLLAARAQDPDALNELCRLLLPRIERIVAVLLRRCLRGQVASLGPVTGSDDLVQGILVAVVADLDRIHATDEDGFEGYLFVASRNQLLSAVRHHHAARRDIRRRVPCSHALQEPSAERSPLDELVMRETRGAVDAALGRLPVRTRALILARFQQRSISFERLATNLHFSSESAARRACHSGLKKLEQTCVRGRA